MWESEATAFGDLTWDPNSLSLVTTVLWLSGWHVRCSINICSINDSNTYQNKIRILQANISHPVNSISLLIHPSANQLHVPGGPTQGRSSSDRGSLGMLFSPYIHCPFLFFSCLTPLQPVSDIKTHAGQMWPPSVLRFCLHSHSWYLGIQSVCVDE